MRSLFETVYLARHGETEWNRIELTDLAEIHHGDMAGLSEAQIAERFPGAFDERARDKYVWAFPNGESYAVADTRAAAALSAIAHTDVHRPLIVSHEMIGRMLLKQLLGLEPSTALAERHPNNVVNVVAPRSAERTTIVT